MFLTKEQAYSDTHGLLEGAFQGSFLTEQAAYGDTQRSPGAPVQLAFPHYLTTVPARSLHFPILPMTVLL